MYIKNPLTNKKIFLDNRYSSYEDRLREVKKWVLSKNEIVDYCLNNSIIKSKSQMFSYYSAEKILENAGTYLLLGQYRENNIMTIYKIRKASVLEMPASSLNSNAADILWSSSDYYETPNSNPYFVSIIEQSEFDKSLLNKTQYENNDVFSSVKENEKRTKKKREKKKNTSKSKSKRLQRLYTTESIKTYRIKQQFEKINGEIIPIKNIFGQPVFDTENIIIGGHKGIIDESNMYRSSWCIVNTDNIFCFDGVKYKINEKIKQYKVKKDNQCEMEKILVVPTRDRLKFFDENIKEVLDKWIQKV